MNQQEGLEKLLRDQWDWEEDEENYKRTIKLFSEFISILILKAEKRGFQAGVEHAFLSSIPIELNSTIKKFLSKKHQMMKLSKKHLIEFFIESLKKNLILEAEIEQMEEKAYRFGIEMALLKKYQVD